MLDSRVFLAVVLSVTALSAVACKKDDSAIRTTGAGAASVSPSADSANARGTSLVRVVNVGHGGKDIALRMTDQVLFDNVKPQSVTDYREVASNAARFSARIAGSSDTTTLSRNDELLVDGGRYTVFLIAEDSADHALRVIKDDVVPDSGKARIRVVHAAPGGPDLDVSIANATDKLFSGVDFQSEAGYKDLAPAKIVLEVRAKGEQKVLLRLPPLDLKPGTATTVVITGASKLAFFTFTDAMLPTARK